MCEEILSIMSHHTESLETLKDEFEGRLCYLLWLLGPLMSFGTDFAIPFSRLPGFWGPHVLWYRLGYTF